jgi:hypothetical protein
MGRGEDAGETAGVKFLGKSQDRVGRAPWCVGYSWRMTSLDLREGGDGQVVAFCSLYCCMLLSKKQELNGRPMYEYRCEERLKAKAEGSTRLAYNGLRGELEHI